MEKLYVATRQEFLELIGEGVKMALACSPTDNSGKIETDSKVLQIEKPVTVKELCCFLGVTEPTIIRWRKKGKIPFMQVGSRVLFQKSAVLKALENKKS